jgi:hypothetical protein
VVSVQPRMRVADDGSLEVVIPSDPGFDDLEDVAPDPEALAGAARAAAKKGRPIAEVAQPQATSFRKAETRELPEGQPPAAAAKKGRPIVEVSIAED